MKTLNDLPNRKKLEGKRMSWTQFKLLRSKEIQASSLNKVWNLYVSYINQFPITYGTLFEEIYTLRIEEKMKDWAGFNPFPVDYSYYNYPVILGLEHGITFAEVKKVGLHMKVFNQLMSMFK